MTDSDPNLPELDAEEERRLSRLLKSAFSPGEIDPRRHERLLQAALEDPFAPASTDELAESERLRQALDGAGNEQHLDLVLARALAAAHAPGDARPRVEPVLAPPVQKPGKVVYFRFATATVALAAAAAVVLAITQQASPDSRAAASSPDLPALALAQSRSTAALFQADSAGAPSDRIDRIASARGRELRDNRYALWGVR